MSLARIQLHDTSGYMVILQRPAELTEDITLTLPGVTSGMLQLAGENSNSVEIAANKIAVDVTTGDVVYVENGMYKKAYCQATKNNTQTAIGIYIKIGLKHYVYFDGVVQNVGTGLLPGKIYYLADTPGDLQSSIGLQNVILGRAVSTTDILLRIEGDVDYVVVLGLFNTNVTNGLSLNGVTYTDPNNTSTLNFDNLTYDQTVPAKVMFISTAGVITKIDYAQEYGTKPFNIIKNSVTYSGVFTENEDYTNPTIIS